MIEHMRNKRNENPFQLQQGLEAVLSGFIKIFLHNKG